jgi:hypothetical protein
MVVAKRAALGDDYAQGDRDSQSGQPPLKRSGPEQAFFSLPLSTRHSVAINGLAGHELRADV